LRIDLPVIVLTVAFNPPPIPLLVVNLATSPTLYPLPPSTILNESTDPFLTDSTKEIVKKALLTAKLI